MPYQTGLQLLFAAIDTDQDATNLQIAIAGLQQLLQQTMTHQQTVRENHDETNYDAASNHSDSTLRSYDPLRDGPLDSLKTAPGLLLGCIKKLTKKLDLWATSSTKVISVVLSAFEVLSAIADYVTEVLPAPLVVEQSRLVVESLCHFIQQSIGRPKLEHRRELHRTVQDQIEKFNIQNRKSTFICLKEKLFRKIFVFFISILLMILKLNMYKLFTFHELFEIQSIPQKSIQCWS